MRRHVPERDARQSANVNAHFHGGAARQDVNGGVFNVRAFRDFVGLNRDVLELQFIQLC